MKNSSDKIAIRRLSTWLIAEMPKARSPLPGMSPTMLLVMRPPSYCSGLRGPGIFEITNVAFRTIMYYTNCVIIPGNKPTTLASVYTPKGSTDLFSWLVEALVWARESCSSSHNLRGKIKIVKSFSSLKCRSVRGIYLVLYGIRVLIEFVWVSPWVRKYLLIERDVRLSTTSFTVQFETFAWSLRMRKSKGLQIELCFTCFKATFSPLMKLTSFFISKYFTNTKSMSKGRIIIKSTCLTKLKPFVYKNYCASKFYCKNPSNSIKERPSPTTWCIFNTATDSVAL